MIHLIEVVIIFLHTKLNVCSNVFSEDQRRWFINQEVNLFRMRFEALGDEDAKLFLNLNNLQYDTVSSNRRILCCYF